MEGALFDAFNALNGGGPGADGDGDGDDENNNNQEEGNEQNNDDNNNGGEDGGGGGGPGLAIGAAGGGGAAAAGAAGAAAAAAAAAGQNNNNNVNALPWGFAQFAITPPGAAGAAGGGGGTNNLADDDEDDGRAAADAEVGAAASPPLRRHERPAQSAAASDAEDANLHTLLCAPAPHWDLVLQRIQNKPAEVIRYHDFWRTDNHDRDQDHDQDEDEQPPQQQPRNLHSIPMLNPAEAPSALVHILSHRPPNRCPPSVVHATIRTCPGAALVPLSEGVVGRGSNLLHLAAECGACPQVITTLSEQDPKIVMSPDYMGNLPLHYATRVDTARALLRIYPKSVRIASFRNGDLPLHCAVRRYHVDIEVLSVLLDYGLKWDVGGVDGRGGINVKNKRGRTPLDEAGRRVLIDTRRADVTTAEGARVRSVAIAAISAACSPPQTAMDEDEQIRRYWLEQARESWRKVMTLLKFAYRGPQELLPIASSSLASEEDSSRSLTGAHVAHNLGCSCDGAASIERHLEEETSVIRTRTDDDGLTFPVVHALIALRCDPTFIEYAILRYPDQLRRKDTAGRLPLHIASSDPTTPPELLKRLIDPSQGGCPCSAHALDRSGRLPLHDAAESGRTFDDDDGLEILLSAYPRSLETRDGRTHLFPFMLAATATVNDRSQRHGHDDAGNDGGLDNLNVCYTMLLRSPNLVMA